MRSRIFALVWTLSAIAATSRAASDDFVREHYVKHEYRVAMRDGVKLFTSVYAPRDGGQKYPILLMRTPYSVAPYGETNYRQSLGPRAFEDEKFIFVFQDVRGRYMSEGDFIDMPPRKTHFTGTNDTDSSTDCYDTIDWLVKNISGNNGRVGLWGYSYPGFFATFGVMNSHPALKAASLQAPMADVGNGDDSYHNGAFYLAANFGFYAHFWPRGPQPSEQGGGHPFDFGTPDNYEFYLRMGPISNADRICFHGENPYWSDNLAHPNYDEFWASRALAPDLHNVKAPVLLVGGWYDSEDLGGVPKLFHALDKNKHIPRLTYVMGPWSHGEWVRQDGDRLGNVSFGSKTSEFYRTNIELPFFVKALKDGKPAKLPRAWMFETGKDEWHSFSAWPPKHTVKKPLYFCPGGKLSFSPPPAAEGFDEYVSDPARPVPVNSKIGGGMPADYMTGDERFAAQRPDVLVYETEPLREDVTLAGPVTPVLKVSTSGTDSDFIVKLIDVYPDGSPGMGGYEQLVRGEPFRGKFRNSRSRPEAFVPGEPSTIQFAMPDIFHDFRKGHRIMVQIQSSWFPMVDRNPQKFVNIPTAGPQDFQKATERVYYGGGDGTRLDVLRW